MGFICLYVLIQKSGQKQLNPTSVHCEVLAKTTRGEVHLQQFRPSVIRGPWPSHSLACKNSYFVSA